MRPDNSYVSHQRAFGKQDKQGTLSLPEMQQWNIEIAVLMLTV
jgi:hypothetical protein